MCKDRRITVKQVTSIWSEGSEDTNFPSNHVTIPIRTEVIQFEPLTEEKLSWFQRVRHLTPEEFKKEFPDA